MQRLVKRTLGLVLLGAVLSACSSGSAPPDTQAPTVSLTASPTTLAAGGTVSLSASASDNVGVRKVEFYDGATKLGEDTTAPYALNAPATSVGVHPYTAKAYDAAGNAGTSAVQNVTVTSSGLGLGVWDSSNWDAAEFQ